MAIQFRKATKQQAKLRLAFCGPSGAGKTYSALAVASALGQRIAVIDSERGSASKYADLFAFDVLELTTFEAAKYVEAIAAAEDAGYEVIVIDSLSHAWVGEGGVLDLVDEVALKVKGNKMAAWKEGTPAYRKLVDRMLQSKAHLIATMRSKTEWDLEYVDERGRKTPKKIGTAPVMRDGIEFEFDVTGTLDFEHNLVIDKTRCVALDGKVVKRPGAQFAATLKAWLSDGAPVPKAAASVTTVAGVPLGPVVGSETITVPPAEESEEALLAERIAASNTPEDLAAVGALIGRAKERLGPDAVARLRAAFGARKAALAQPVEAA